MENEKPFKKWALEEGALLTQSFEELVHTAGLRLRVRVQVFGHSSLKQTWERGDPHDTRTALLLVFTSPFHTQTRLAAAAFSRTRNYLLKTVLLLAPALAVTHLTSVICLV